MALNKHQDLLFKLEAKLGSCSGKHCDLIQQHLDRAKAAQQRATKAKGRASKEDFGDLNTVRKIKCKKDCNTGTPETTGGESNPEIGVEIADQLDEVAAGLDSTNQILSEPAPLRSFFRGAPSTPDASLYDYTQDPNYPTWLHTITVDPQADVGVRFAAQLAAGIAETVNAVSEKACNQVVVAAGFGGNGSVACTVLAVIFHALKATSDLLQFVGDDTQGWEVHGAYVRAADIHTHVNQLQASVGDTATQLQNLQNQVTALKYQLNASKAIQEQIIQLLLVPEGKRTVNPSVLTCTGNNDCPKVLACPGSGCSFNPR